MPVPVATGTGSRQKNVGDIAVAVTQTLQIVTKKKMQILDDLSKLLKVWCPLLGGQLASLVTQTLLGLTMQPKIYIAVGLPLCHLVENLCQQQITVDPLQQKCYQQKTSPGQ